MTKCPLIIRAWLFALLCVSVFIPAVRAQDRNVLFREQFESLDNWKPFFFPKIKNHSVYTIEYEGRNHVLKAESHAAASAIVYKEPFNVYDYPKVRWRWKVNNIYEKGDAKTKAGDDYPMRVYIMFEYDPAKAGTFEKIKYGLAKKLYDVYPPHSSLSYVWASREESESIIESPYTDKAKMVLLQKGVKNVGTWQDEEINILEDYQKAFGAKPPVMARTAIMNDSDNTGESSVSYMEFIEVFK